MLSKYGLLAQLLFALMSAFVSKSNETLMMDYCMLYTDCAIHQRQVLLAYTVICIGLIADK
jgi:hypothetical protein